jgi:hypothetical protein
MAKFLKVSGSMFINVDKIISAKLIYKHIDTDDDTLSLIIYLQIQTESHDIMECIVCNINDVPRKNLNFISIFNEYRSSFDLKEYFQLNGVTI